MDLLLYANLYTDETNGNKWLTIYQGVYHDHHGNRVVKRLGAVNMTTRIFIKMAKHPRKVIHEEGDSIFLFLNDYGNPGYTLINVVFAENGYPESLLNEITNVVITNSYNSQLKTNNHNSLGGENDGIVHF